MIVFKLLRVINQTTPSKVGKKFSSAFSCSLLEAAEVSSAGPTTPHHGCPTPVELRRHCLNKYYYSNVRRSHSVSVNRKERL